MQRLLLILVATVFLHQQMMAEGTAMQPRVRQYTAEHPLVYEDGWEKWPYAFINDDNRPSGCNVELVKAALKRLDIPYVIRLRQQTDVHEDMRTGEADLTFGVDANYNANYGLFSKEAMASFDNAILQPRGDSVAKYTLDDLRQMHFTVKNNSRAYFYLHENGFSDSVLTTTDDIDDEVLRIATENQGAVLWNTMMLKWMVNKYHLDNLQVIPADIPSGNYCFLSSDTVLLNKLDSVTRLLKQEGTIDRIVTKWLYPEQEEKSYAYIYILVTLLSIFVIMLIAIVSVKYYRTYYSRNTLRDVNSQMELVLHANHTQVWVYFPLTQRYAWMTHSGLVNEEYASFDFSQFYPGTDFSIIHNTVMELLSNDSGPITKTLRSYSLTKQDTVLDVEVRMQVLRDDYGKIYLISGIQRNITDNKAYLERMRLLHERHQVAFNIALGAIIRFDGTGKLVDINDRACVKMGIRDKSRMLSQGFTFEDFGVFNDIDFRTMPSDLRFTARIPNREMAKFAPISNYDTFNPDPERHPDFYTKREIERNERRMSETGYYYVHLVKSLDKQGNVLSVIMYLKDITESVNMQRSLRRRINHEKVLREKNKAYLHYRNHMLQSYDIWLFHYHPDTLMLELFDYESGKTQRMTQLQMLAIVDQKDMKRVFRALRKVDGRERSNVHLQVATLMRNADGVQRQFALDAQPMYGRDGNVERYFGICRDITAELTIQSTLKYETMRAREAELVRQNFLRNTSYSIRQPLVAMQQSIEKIAVENDREKELQLLSSITNNTQRLIMLSDDTLLLSRIEAGLFTPVIEEHDFVQVYHSVIEEVKQEYGNESVLFSVQNTYENLMLMFDKSVISRILREVVALSARYTQYGTITCRYLYRKDQLTLSVENMGNSIPESLLENIYNPHYVSDLRSVENFQKLSGLEMPLCKSLIDTLKGHIDIDSDPAYGLSIYIMLPVQQSTAEDSSAPSTP